MEKKIAIVGHGPTPSLALALATIKDSEAMSSKQPVSNEDIYTHTISPRPGMTVITLSNGKKVGNFSSPHPFTFTDGSILPACPDEMAERLKVEFIETLHPNGDVELDFEVTKEMIEAMTPWLDKKEKGEVDVVFCPLPMITALKKTFMRDWFLNSPFRAIRVEDRIKKLISIDKQCI